MHQFNSYLPIHSLSFSLKLSPAINFRHPNLILCRGRLAHVVDETGDGEDRELYRYEEAGKHYHQLINLISTNEVIIFFYYPV